MGEIGAVRKGWAVVKAVCGRSSVPRREGNEERGLCRERVRSPAELVRGRGAGTSADRLGE